MFVYLFSDSEAMEVKSSTSISALDAISEAPEPEDVDMMSQVDILKKYFVFEEIQISIYPHTNINIPTNFEKKSPTLF